jgi:hypothetical protein
MSVENKAKIRVLQVRPSQSADLAFNAPGILARQNYDRARGGPAHLGESVQRFDIENELYNKLAETDPASDGARLIYDSQKIRDSLESRFLFQQRNYTLAAALDQMIVRRENAFLERFKHKNLIKAAMTKAYPEKVQMIQEALNSAKSRFEALDAAYRTGKVETESKTTTTHLPGSHIQNNGSVDVEPMAMYSGSWEKPNNIIKTDIKDKDGNLSSVHETQAGGSFPHKYVGQGNWGLIEGRFKSQHTDSKADHHLKFESTTPNQVFLHPQMDNRVAYRRLRAELLTQEMNESIFSHRVAAMDKILENELAALDMEVRKLQLAYAHSFLTSPMSGIVAGIYKDVGEAATTAEPVMRVENDTVILAVGLITYRSLVWVGKKADIRTIDLYEEGKEFVFPGKIVAVRGHEADNDVWDIIIECENPVDGTGKRVLPLNYTFDKDNAWVEF